METELIVFTKNIIESLVNDAESVSVQQFEDEDTITLEVLVSEDDMGQIIGRNGRIIKAVRTLILAYGYHHKLNYIKINVDSF